MLVKSGSAHCGESDQFEGGGNTDSAYRSQQKEASLATANIASQICEKGARNHPLTAEQKASIGMMNLVYNMMRLGQLLRRDGRVASAVA